MNCLLSSRASAFGSGLTCKSCRFTGQSSINLHLLKCQTRFGVALGVEINRSSCVFFSLSFRTWKARCKTLAITPLIYTWHFALSWSVFFSPFPVLVVSMPFVCVPWFEKLVKLSPHYSAGLPFLGLCYGRTGIKIATLFELH